MAAYRPTEDSNILGLDFEGLTLVDTAPFNATTIDTSYLQTPSARSLSLKGDFEITYGERVYVAHNEYTSWTNDIEVPGTGDFAAYTAEICAAIMNYSRETAYIPRAPRVRCIPLDGEPEVASAPQLRPTALDFDVAGLPVLEHANAYTLDNDSASWLSSSYGSSCASSPPATPPMRCLSLDGPYIEDGEGRDYEALALSAESSPFERSLLLKGAEAHEAYVHIASTEGKAGEDLLPILPYLARLQPFGTQA